MTKPLASLSLDLDNLWSYQKTHGDPRWERLESYLDVLVPRVLRLLADRDLTITFFVVGQDAELDRNRDALSQLVEAGHEIANHSFRHEPWLHRYSEAELDEELARAEDAIAGVGADCPVGFRGPGYSLSEGTLRVLAERGYRYDASTLPTVIGPLARAYYFRSARLTPEQREERSHLFGSARDGLRPLKPYRWDVGDGSLLELPVTTMPVARVPIHVSYLLFLAGASPRAALGYWRGALRLCRLRGVEPSILLHPLDVLGGDDVAEVGFFPGMGLTGARKLELVGIFLDALAAGHQITTMREHAEQIQARGGLRLVRTRHAGPIAHRADA